MTTETKKPVDVREVTLLSLRDMIAAVEAGEVIVSIKVSRDLNGVYRVEVLLSRGAQLEPFEFNGIKAPTPPLAAPIGVYTGDGQRSKQMPYVDPSPESIAAYEAWGNGGVKVALAADGEPRCEKTLGNGNADANPCGGSCVRKHGHSGLCCCEGGFGVPGGCPM